MSDYQYINIPINYDSSYGNAPSPAIGNVVRNVAYVNNIQDYYISVGRVSIPALSLPMFCPPLVVGSDYSENKTIFSFTLEVGGYTSGQQNVIYIPTNQNVAPYTGTVSTALQTKNSYYYTYDIFTFCRMLNNTLLTAYNALIADGATLPTGKQPVFYFDEALSSIVLLVDMTTYDTNGNSPVVIYFNNQFAPIFNGFSFITLANNDPNGKDNYFIIENQVNNISGTNYLMSGFNWSIQYLVPIQTLQITTSLPIAYEYINNPNSNYGGVALVQTTISNNPSSNILIDLQPDFSTLASINGVQIYNKVDNWRWAQVLGSGALSSATFSIVWTDFAQNSIQVYLEPTTFAEIKLILANKNNVRGFKDKN